MDTHRAVYVLLGINEGVEVYLDESLKQLGPSTRQLEMTTVQ